MRSFYLLPSIPRAGGFFETRGPCEISEGVVRGTADDLRVGAVDLGPRLLDQEHPQLPAVGLRKARAAVFAGEEVVDDDAVFEAVLGETQSVDPLFVRAFGREELADPLGVFGQNAEHAQKVAVPQLALVDVRRLDDAVENLAPLQRLDLSRSDPLDRRPFLSKLFISAPRRYKTLYFWRKSAVGELETLGFRQVQLIITVIFPILATTIWIISTHLSIKYLSYNF